MHVCTGQGRPLKNSETANQKAHLKCREVQNVELHFSSFSSFSFFFLHTVGCPEIRDAQNEDREHLIWSDSFVRDCGRIQGKSDPQSGKSAV